MYLENALRKNVSVFMKLKPKKLTSSQIRKSIVLGELLGFSFLICLIWLDEIFDIPHRVLGLQPEPANIPEAFLESTLVFILAAGIIFVNIRLLYKIKTLEGCLPICSFCKKIRHEGKWEPIESYIHDRSMAEFTHGMCPDCAKENYGIEIT